jgi:hypothetical protein
MVGHIIGVQDGEGKNKSQIPRGAAAFFAPAPATAEKLPSSGD